MNEGQKTHSTISHVVRQEASAARIVPVSRDHADRDHRLILQQHSERAAVELGSPAKIVLQLSNRLKTSVLIRMVVICLPRMRRIGFSRRRWKYSTR